VARGELMTNNHLLAMNPGTAEESLDGIATREPTYGLPAVWIKAREKENALAKGYTVVDLATVMTTHFSEVIRRHAHELLGRQDVQKLLDDLKASHPKVVEELVPNLLTLGGVVRVLHNLLREQIPIRDLLAILETLADRAPMTKDPEILTEYVRQALSRTITKLHQSAAGRLPVIILGPGVEQAVSAAIQTTDHGRLVALEPAVAQKIVNHLAELLETAAGRGIQPALLCSAQIRGPFKRLLDRFIPNLAVLSYDEVLPDAAIQSLGTVELSHAD